jgi:hypothetical protein
MSDFWFNVVPLSLVALGAFLIVGIGQLIMNDMERDQVRYEQCIAADKQWINGSCVK